MGREGVAYTFVTTEEGGELTRIEMLINRLLKRDEIEGFMAVSTTCRIRRPLLPQRTRARCIGRTRRTAAAEENATGR